MYAKSIWLNALAGVGFIMQPMLLPAAWNSPYPPSEPHLNTLYLAFFERPKHLDPAQSYSEEEAAITQQIYEPPLQYHFLQRPYVLEPLTVSTVPQPRYHAADGRLLPESAPAADIAVSVYRLELRRGILYEPHPAFATRAEQDHLYHTLTDSELERVQSLADLPERGTRELTAEDYVYQIKRLAHPALQSPILGFLGEYVVGLSALAKQLAELRASESAPVWLDLRKYDLPGARVVDRYTFEITLKGKYPQFIYWLTMPFFAPVPWEADRFFSQPGLQARNISLDWLPLGTGPYRLIENNPNRRMILERNPNFRGEPYPEQGEAADVRNGMLRDRGQVMPFVDKVVYSLEQETIPAWTKFLQGYYDVSGLSSDSFDQAVTMGAGGQAVLTTEMRARGIELIEAVRPSNYYFGFNMLDAVVGGSSERARLLRLAISIALDYEEYISIFANGRGIPAHGAIPPGIFGYRDDAEGLNPYVYAPGPDRPQRKPVSEAQALLQAAGYPGGRDPASGQALVVYYDTALTGPDAKPRLDWLRKQFEKIGLQLVVRATDYNRFQDKVRNGVTQMFEWGWNADYPDPENFLFLLYGPNGKVRFQGENASNYSNGEFDRLFEQMKNMENSPARQDVIDRMQEQVRHDAPWAWGWYPVSYTLHHGWLSNAKPNLMARNTLKYKRLDTAVRTRAQEAWNVPVLWPMLLVVVIVPLIFLPVVLLYRRHDRETAL